MEKRDLSRHGKRLIVKFGEDSPIRTGFTGDISLTGLFIKSPQVYPPGTHLEIELILPDSRVFSLLGKVMWAKKIPQSMIRFAKKGGMGIQLMPAPEEFKRFVESIKP